MFCGAPYSGEEYTCKACGSVNDARKKRFDSRVRKNESIFSFEPREIVLRTTESAFLTSEPREIVRMNVNTVKKKKPRREMTRYNPHVNESKAAGMVFIVLTIFACFAGLGYLWYRNHVVPLYEERFIVNIVDGDTGKILDGECFMGCTYAVPSLEDVWLAKCIENTTIDRLTEHDLDIVRYPGYYFITSVYGMVPVNDTNEVDVYYGNRWFVLDPVGENNLSMYRTPSIVNMVVFNSSFNIISFNENTSINENVTFVLNVANGTFVSQYNFLRDEYDMATIRVTFTNFTHIYDFVMDGAVRHRYSSDIIDYTFGVVRAGINKFSGHFTSEETCLRSVKFMYGETVLWDLT